MYERALEHVQDLYRSKGYLSAEVGPASLVRTRCDPRVQPGVCRPLAPPRLPEYACSYDDIGLPVLEGYGLTETSPVTNVNLPDTVPTEGSRGPVLPNHRFGSVGLFIPGVAVRITDPETHEPLSLHASGMIWVRGANIFGGYLGQPEKTAAALDDTTHVAAAVNVAIAERARIASRLTAAGTRVIPSAGNFLLLHVGAEARQKFEALLRRGIIVRPVANYRLPEHLRVSLGTVEQNDRFLQAWEAC